MWKETSKSDREMNNRILVKVRPELFSQESLAKSYFKSKHSLVGIAADERYDIQKAMLENWGSQSGFVEEMSGKFDRSDAQWEALFDNEMHNADQAGEMLVEARKGKETKSWMLGPSKSGPCDECAALAAENQDVPIGEAFSNGEKICSAHPGCCCSAEYSDGSDGE
jgi:hypothetical protein